MKRTALALILAAIFFGSGWRILTAQQQGGAFVPNFAYQITCGCWNWSAGFLVGTSTAAQTVAALQMAVVTLTNAQVLALNTTPITLVAAPAAGFVIDPTGWSVAFKETAAYSSVTDLELYYTSRSGANAACVPITAVGLLDQSANTIRRAGCLTDNETLPTTAVPLVVQAITAGAMGGGNAANTVNVAVEYRIINRNF